jgi:hypothetical protein
MRDSGLPADVLLGKVNKSISFAREATPGHDCPGDFTCPRRLRLASARSSADCLVGRVRVPAVAVVAARAAVLAFGDELLDLVLPADEFNWLSPVEFNWLSPGGRGFAAAYLLPRAEAALRQELQRLVDAA